jgi:hypothetical protein
MNAALFSMALGLVLSVASSVVLWYCARQVRTANGTGPWSSDWTATSVSLGIVTVIVTGMAFCIQGAMGLVSEPMLGIALGGAVSLILQFGTVRLLGPLPEQKC